MELLFKLFVTGLLLTTAAHNFASEAAPTITQPKPQYIYWLKTVTHNKRKICAGIPLHNKKCLVVGTLEYTYNPAQGLIDVDILKVAETARGHGIGNELLNCAKNAAHSKGYSRLKLLAQPIEAETVAQKHEIAQWLIPFYEKAGFTINTRIEEKGLLTGAIMTCYLNKTKQKAAQGGDRKTKLPPIIPTRRS